MAACAQVNKTVVKAVAYYTIPVPGTIAVDENGRQMPPPRTKVFTVYLETKGIAPQWTKAWADGQSFTLIPFATGFDTTVVVGRAIRGDRNISLKPAKGNRITKLELAPDGKVTVPPQKIAGNEVLLEGSVKGKRFYYKITGLTELASPEYQ